jgi:hypothetical protein
MYNFLNANLNNLFQVISKFVKLNPKTILINMKN